MNYKFDDNGFLNVATVDENGILSRVCYAPNTNIDDLPKAAQSEAKKVWTKEVVTQYEKTLKKNTDELLSRIEAENEAMLQAKKEAHDAAVKEAEANVLARLKAAGYDI